MKFPDSFFLKSLNILLNSQEDYSKVSQKQVIDRKKIGCPKLLSSQEISII
jgi:hypothetical protein